jgi:hypothetical protein
MIAVHPAIAASGSKAMHQSRSETWDGAEHATTSSNTDCGIHMPRIAAVPTFGRANMALWRISNPEA